MTASGGEGDTIRALDAGADDVVAKPVSAAELSARVRAVVRRTRRARVDAESSDELVSCGAIRIDVARHEVEVEGRRVHVTPTEFQLLLLLARAQGRYVSVDRLLQELWPLEEHEPYHLRVHVSTLRRKVERDPGRPRWILTSVGVGYRVNRDG